MVSHAGDCCQLCGSDLPHLVQVSLSGPGDACECLGVAAAGGCGHVLRFYLLVTSPFVHYSIYISRLIWILYSF